MPLTISDRLKALGVKVGAGDLKPPPPSRSTDIVSLLKPLNARWLQTPMGEACAVERRYPLGAAHGRSALQMDVSLEALAAWAGEPRLRSIPPQGLAFLDIETTGLAGGTGTYAFLIGAGRFEADEFLLSQFFLPDPLQEPAELAALEAFLAPCAALVTFNGKAFDAPLLNTRYIFHGLHSPLRDLAHIDLLPLARRLWRDRLPSRTLGNLEVQILGALRTEEDIPGWMIPDIYFEFLRGNDASLLRGVFYHNAMDVLSLAALLNHTAGLLSDPLQLGAQFGIDLIALGKLFEDLGELDLAARLYLSGLEHDDARLERLPRSALLQALQRLALIHKRRANLEAAIQLWQQAAQQADLQAHVELAKFYEHHLKDYPQAIYWTESALAALEQASAGGGDLSLSAYQRRQWMFELQHRLERLVQKARR